MGRVSARVLSVLEVTLLVALTLWALHVSDRAAAAETRLEQVRYQVRELEQRHNALAEDYAFKIRPEQIDASQRAWFSELLKNDPQQVRGVDGQLPKFRDE